MLFVTTSAHYRHSRFVIVSVTYVYQNISNKFVLIVTHIMFFFFYIFWKPTYIHPYIQHTSISCVTRPNETLLCCQWPLKHQFMSSTPLVFIIQSFFPHCHFRIRGFIWNWLAGNVHVHQKILNYRCQCHGSIIGVDDDEVIMVVVIIL